MNRESRPVDEESPFRILFVCTGNTCRSPMAEGIARRELEARGWGHVRVDSAGVAAFPGSPISEGALRAGHRHGVDLDRHRSTPISRPLLDEADLVLAMSPAHLRPLEEAGYGQKATLLPTFARGATEIRAGEGVRDPIGGDDSLYEATFHELEELVRKALDQLAPVLESSGE